MNYNKNEAKLFKKKCDFLKTLFVLSIISYYLFVFTQQISIILDLNLLHEELRQLFPYYHINDPSLFSGDYITSYYLSSNQPVLYDFITSSWLSYGGNLLQLHRIMPIILWILLLVSVALVGWKLQGIIGFIGTFGLVLSQPLFLYQITSAIPHAFAFPLLGWALVALLYNSVLGVVVLTLLSSALYPLVTPIIGLSLAGYLLIFYKDKLKVLSPSIIIRVIAILGVVGGISIILGSTVLQPKEGFGEPLALFQEIEKYPENGPEGRNFIGVTNPQFYILSKFLDQFKEAINLSGWNIVLLLIYLSLSLYGFISYTKNSQNKKMLEIFILVNIIVISLAFVLKPFWVYRFFLYPFAIIFSVLLPLGVTKIFSYSKNTNYSSYLPLLFLFMFTLTLDGGSQKNIGYSSKIDAETRKVLDFVQKLPKNALIAGWPTHTVGRNVTELIPYITKHRVLILGKAHYPSHQGYLIEMRQRMYLLIDAYSTSNVEPIKKLRDNYGVSYFLVNKSYVTYPPKYFAPFQDYIENRWQTRMKEGFLLSKSVVQGKIFESEGYFILDINKFLAGDSL